MGVHGPEKARRRQGNRNFYVQVLRGRARSTRVIPGAEKRARQVKKKDPEIQQGRTIYARVVRNHERKFSMQTLSILQSLRYIQGQSREKISLGERNGGKGLLTIRWW